MKERDLEILQLQLSESLTGRQAHITIDRVLEGFPLDRINDHVNGFDHSPWQLLEHIRIAQKDILDFALEGEYEERNWPQGFWPMEQGTAQLWQDSMNAFYADRASLNDMIQNENSDFFKSLRHGKKYNLLRQLLIIANHNSYHLGQLLMLRRIFEKV